MPMVRTRSRVRNAALDAAHRDLAVIGATTLSVAGVDQRIALHNRKHMMVMNTGDAGTEHARYQLEHEDPPNEGVEPRRRHLARFRAGDRREDTMFDGLSYAHNLRVYWVPSHVPPVRESASGVLHGDREHQVPKRLLGDEVTGAHAVYNLLQHQ